MYFVLYTVTVCLALASYEKYFVFAQFSLSVGDSCALNSGGRGTCKSFEDCDENLLKSEPGDPTICSWGADAVVCCPPNRRGEQRPQRRPPTQSGGAKSKQKCKGYSEIKKNINSTHTIIGGERVTSPEEFPHMALLGFGETQSPLWRCGGALISEQYILTAAHCTESRDGLKPVVAIIGFLNINRKNEFKSLQQFNIVDIKRHPDHNPPQTYADIALLRLSKQVKFTKFVLPACLHLEKNIGFKFATATGWGSLQYGTNSVSEDLMKVSISLKSNAECFNIYPADRRLTLGIVEDLQFCAGDTNRDTCQGDSGGPLQTYHPEFIYMHDIIGVTSFGRNCGKQPGVFTRVSQYVPWIESVVWP